MVAPLTAAQVQKNLTLILAEYQVNKTKLLQGSTGPVDPYDLKTPLKDNRILNFQQNSNDVTGDSTLTARSAGDLTRGKTRLNIISALTKGDKVDFFKFNVTEKENLGIAIQTDKDIRTQILNAKGQVIADSEARFGEKYDNFQKAGKQALELDKGQYFIKVTRPTGTLDSVKPNYAIQLATTKYFEKDYTTIEKPAVQQTYGSAYAQSGASMYALLNQVYGGMFDSAYGTYYSKEV